MLEFIGWRYSVIKTCTASAFIYHIRKDSLNNLHATILFKSWLISQRIGTVVMAPIIKFTKGVGWPDIGNLPSLGFSILIRYQQIHKSNLIKSWKLVMENKPQSNDIEAEWCPLTAIIVEGTSHKKIKVTDKQKPEAKKGVESSVVDSESINHKIGVNGCRKKKKRSRSRGRNCSSLCNRARGYRFLVLRGQ